MEDADAEADEEKKLFTLVPVRWRTDREPPVPGPTFDRESLLSPSLRSRKSVRYDESCEGIGSEMCTIDLSTELVVLCDDGNARGEGF